MTKALDKAHAIAGGFTEAQARAVITSATKLAATIRAMWADVKTHDEYNARSKAFYKTSAYSDADVKVKGAIRIALMRDRHERFPETKKTRGTQNKTTAKKDVSFKAKTISETATDLASELDKLGEKELQWAMDNIESVRAMIAAECKAANTPKLKARKAA